MRFKNEMYVMNRWKLKTHRTQSNGETRPFLVASTDSLARGAGLFCLISSRDAPLQLAHSLVIRSGGLDISSLA